MRSVYLVFHEFIGRVLIHLSTTRSSTSAGASRGSSSTQFHTSASGSSSPTRFRRQASNGSARSKSCSRTSPSRLRQYVSRSVPYIIFHADMYTQIWMFHPVAEAVGLQTWQVPFPSWKTQLPQLAFFFIFEDMFHYFGKLRCGCGKVVNVPSSFLFQLTRHYTPVFCTSASTRSTINTPHPLVLPPNTLTPPRSPSLASAPSPDPSSGATSCRTSTW
jgi:hypothetical protein